MEKNIFKKIMSLVLTFVVAFLVMNNSQRVNAVVVGGMDSRFKDINFYTCVRNAVGESGVESDGYTLKDSALRNITHLNCSGNAYKINDTTGLHLMPNLSELILLNGNNHFTSINISKNTKLRELSLYCPKITSINLSKNTNLKYLKLKFAQITSIDLTKNAQLYWLELTGTKITSINLSKNTDLKTLKLSSSKLKSINLTKHTKLEWLEIDNNQLTSINLNKNEKLKHLALQQNSLANKPSKCIQLGNNCSFGYIVKFQTNGGSAIKTVNVVTIKISPKPTKKGYSFAGWYKNANFTSPVSFPFSPSSDITLYAKWTPLSQEEETTSSPNKTTIIAVVVGVLVVVGLLMVSSSKPKQTRKTTRKRRSSSKPTAARKTSTTRTRTGTKKKLTNNKKKK